MNVIDVAVMAEARRPSNIDAGPEKSAVIDQPRSLPDGRSEPTAEELLTLRRVTGKIPWTAYTVTFIELCERFSYYGTTAICTSKCFESNIWSLQSFSRQLHSATTPLWVAYRQHPAE